MILDFMPEFIHYNKAPDDRQNLPGGGLEEEFNSLINLRKLFLLKICF